MTNEPDTSEKYMDADYLEMLARLTRVVEGTERCNAKHDEIDAYCAKLAGHLDDHWCRGLGWK